MLGISTNISNNVLINYVDKIKSMFRHYNDDKFKNIIDEFILSSSDNESIKYILRNIDFEAFKLGISFYQMIFLLIQKDVIQNRKSQIR
ncbi:MAG TPA: hypothetical protein VF084_09435 [Nitrososphaeraceae archaeon]|jgi:hypothetical protein